jgi:glycosyltransferase involved in cell wall biosynthesis
MDLATQEEIDGYVHLPGRFGNVGEWYQRSDIFVLSSRNEGFPNVLLEAMASGCPCVAFDCDTGPRDLIKHGHNGMLVPAEDIQAFANTLQKVMADQALRDRLSSNAILVRDCFCEHKIFKKWKEVIDNNIFQ